MTLAWPEIAFCAAILILSAIRLCEAHWMFARAPGSDWNSSEWMIDYTAGFVRRGLGGEMLARLMQLTGLGFFPLWTGITTAVYLGACWCLMLRVKRLGGAGVWRFWLLINPALLMFPAESVGSGSFLRKEVLFVAATALLVSMGERMLHRGGAGLPSALLILAAACAVSVALALLHEAFFLFGWLPLNFVLLLAVLRRLGIQSLTAWLLAVSALLPGLVAAAASIHWRGDVRTAQMICQSWHGLSLPTDCTASGQFPPAVEALGWSVSHAVSLPLSLSRRFPFFMLLTAFFAALEIVAIRKLLPQARLDHLLATLTLPLLASLPLYLLGWDWGRYLFTVMGQQVWVLLSDTLRPAVFDEAPGWLQRLATGTARRLAERLDRVTLRTPYAVPVIFSILLVLPVPAVPSGQAIIYASPPVIVIDFVRQLIAHGQL